MQLPTAALPLDDDLVILAFHRVFVERNPALIRTMQEFLRDGGTPREVKEIYLAQHPDSDPLPAIMLERVAVYLQSRK